MKVIGDGPRPHNRTKRHTFSEVSHTKDIDQTDQDAKDGGVEGDVTCLQRLFQVSLMPVRDLLPFTSVSQNESKITAAVISDGMEML